MTSCAQVGKLTAVMRRALIPIIAASLVAGLLVAPVQAIEPGIKRVFQPSGPLRVFDSRLDATPLEAGGTRQVYLNSFVPAGATGVALNITALDSTEPTSITVWPSQMARPYTTVMTVNPGAAQSNSVLLPLNDERAVNLYNFAGTTHVLVDVIGWFNDEFVGVNPQRVLDTRSWFAGTPLSPGATRDLPLDQLTDIPADAVAVALNATAIAGPAPTTVSLRPTGSEPLAVPQFVLGADQVVTQSIVVGLSNGSLSMTNGEGAANLVIDVTGWFRPNGSFAASVPQRVVETKAKLCGIAVGPNETRTVRLTSAGDIGAAMVTMRAEGSSESTYLTIWRAGAPRPAISNLNVMPGTSASNTAVVELGPAGQVDIYNNAGTVEITVDVIGTFRGTTPTGEPIPCPAPPPPPAAPRPSTPPSTAPATTVAPATTAAPPSASWQAEMLAALNALRAERGLVPLALCGSLNRSSQTYAETLASWGKISHTGPDGSDLRSRVAAAGYNGWNTIGENLAAGQDSVSEVMDAWKKSSTHMANLVKAEYRHVGFGRQMGTYQNNANQSWFWVQNFGANGSC